MMPAEPPWSVVVRREDVPETGRHVDLEAGEPERAAVARTAGVDAVERLAASFHLARAGGEGIRVTGQVSAAVHQTCVVSLEPVVNEVSESIDLTFEPARETARSAGEDIDAGKGAVEPEVLVDGAVDLGQLATEFLILGIDPYPRKPGVAFTAPPPSADAAGHPFAALAALKKNST